MPFAQQAHLEALARSHPSLFVRMVASAASLCGLFSLRAIEALRCEFLDGPLNAAADPGTVV